MVDYIKNQYDINNILSLTGNNIPGTMSSGNDVPSYNDIAWFAQGIGTITGGSEVSTEQKVSVIQQGIQKIMSMLSGAMNERANAENENKKNAKAIEDWNKASEHTKKEITEGLDNVGAEIKKQTGIVEDATKDLTEADKQIQKEQEKINQIIEEIALHQKALLTAPAEERAGILQKIQSLSGEINTSVSAITTIEKSVTDASKKVENAVTEIETAKGNAVQIKTDGENKNTALEQQGAQLYNTEITTIQSGAINKTTGETAEKMAQTSSSNVFTGTSVAPKLYALASDQKGAAEIRCQTTNLNDVLQGIGGVKNNTTLLNHFDNAIGTELKAFGFSVGAWNEKLPATITSIGSFETVKAENEVLTKSVEEDLKTITEEKPAEAENKNNTTETSKPETKTQQNDKIPAPEAISSPQNKTEISTTNPENETGLLTPNVKLTKFKTEQVA